MSINKQTKTPFFSTSIILLRLIGVAPGSCSGSTIQISERMNPSTPPASTASARGRCVPVFSRPEIIRAGSLWLFGATARGRGSRARRRGRLGLGRGVGLGVSGGVCVGRSGGGGGGNVGGGDGGIGLEEGGDGGVQVEVVALEVEESFGIGRRGDFAECID